MPTEGGPPPEAASTGGPDVAALTAGPSAGWLDHLNAWVTPAIPVARVARLRLAVYLVVVVDVLFWVNDPIPHSQAPGALYRPLLIRRLLHLPIPSLGYTRTLLGVILVGAALSAFGRWPRTVGVITGLALIDWVSIGYSYSKIDHDHFALIVAVLVLPTVGRARWADHTPSESAGWALRCIQVGCVAIYFLSVLAKIRFGGWDWVTGYTFAWAMVRRGSVVGRALLEPGWILQTGQWAVFTLEALSPLLLVLRGRLLYGLLAIYLAFHLSTLITLGIHFGPLIVCLGAFVPLETWHLKRRPIPKPTA